MQGVRRLIQEHYFNLLMFMLAGGFAMLLVELLMLEHTDGIQLVAVGASITGLLLTLAALFVRGRAATAVAAMLLLLSVTGAIGVYEHLEARNGESASVQSPDNSGYQQAAFKQDGDGDSSGDSSGEAQGEGAAPAGELPPPPLAPLSLAGLSLVGAISVVGASRKES